MFFPSFTTQASTLSNTAAWLAAGQEEVWEAAAATAGSLLDGVAQVLVPQAYAQAVAGFAAGKPPVDAGEPPHAVVSGAHPGTLIAADHMDADASDQEALGGWRAAAPAGTRSSPRGDWSGAPPAGMDHGGGLPLPPWARVHAALFAATHLHAPPEEAPRQLAAAGAVLADLLSAVAAAIVPGGMASSSHAQRSNINVPNGRAEDSFGLGGAVCVPDDLEGVQTAFCRAVERCGGLVLRAAAHQTASQPHEERGSFETLFHASYTGKRRHAAGIKCCDAKKVMTHRWIRVAVAGFHFCDHIVTPRKAEITVFPRIPSQFSLLVARLLVLLPGPSTPCAKRLPARRCPFRWGSSPFCCRRCPACRPLARSRTACRRCRLQWRRARRSTRQPPGALGWQRANNDCNMLRFYGL